MGKKIGVVLSGCGYLDGAEIRESVLTLLAIDRLGGEAVMMAPNISQFHVVDHLKVEEQADNHRNVLDEAARIARGNIKCVTEINVDELDALVFPGGFGVAKNLSTFATQGPEGNMNNELKEMVLKVHNAGKPIGVICISPAVICLALGEKHPEVTIGNDKETIHAIEAMGGKHFVCKASEAHVDRNLKLVSTPAYMYHDAPISEVALGIDKCIQEVFNFL